MPFDVFKFLFDIVKFGFSVFTYFKDKKDKKRDEPSAATDSSSSVEK
ncbi:MAG: hypothetical protein IJC79_04345 [Clostridia bacterium]|nr:hypothetical protein [Clostridia bacterium]